MTFSNRFYVTFSNQIQTKEKLVLEILLFAAATQQPTYTVETRTYTYSIPAPAPAPIIPPKITIIPAPVPAPVNIYVLPKRYWKR